MFVSTKACRSCEPTWGLCSVAACRTPPTPVRHSPTRARSLIDPTTVVNGESSTSTPTTSRPSARRTRTRPHRDARHYQSPDSLTSHPTEGKRADLMWNGSYSAGRCCSQWQPIPPPASSVSNWTGFPSGPPRSRSVGSRHARTGDPGGSHPVGSGTHSAVTSCGGKAICPHVIRMSRWINIAAGGGGLGLGRPRRHWKLVAVAPEVHTSAAYGAALTAATTPPGRSSSPREPRCHTTRESGPSSDAPPQTPRSPGAQGGSARP